MNGICGVTDGCTWPGLYSYEAGQTAGGDIFEWFVKNLVDAKVEGLAEKAGLSVFGYLTEKAQALCPGESGLLALDWWNGNRSPLGSADLSGLIMGMTLNTRPEEIYRALVEATAFGTRSIVEHFEKNGVSVEKIITCGGMSRKSPLLMQIFADVLGRPLEVADRTQTAACGAAMHAMVALGKDRGGYASLEEVSKALARPVRGVYEPNPENHKVYTELFAMYTRLVDFFGRENPEMMSQLKRMKEK
jgi:L-ribulokinase